jgi:hypothetical protein
MKNTKFQKIIVVIIIICLLSYSCTFTYKKTDTSSYIKYYSKINTLGKTKRAMVIMNSGESYFVYNICVSPDLTRWISPESLEEEVTATSNINRIEFRDSFSGCIGGGLFGLPVSLITIYLFTDKNDRKNNVFLTSFYGIGTGVAIGGTLGALKGDKKVFIINDYSDNLNIK